jgi:hypothetical protein
MARSAERVPLRRAEFDKHLEQLKQACTYNKREEALRNASLLHDCLSRAAAEAGVSATRDGHSFIAVPRETLQHARCGACHALLLVPLAVEGTYIHTICHTCNRRIRIAASQCFRLANRAPKAADETHVSGQPEAPP